MEVLAVFFREAWVVQGRELVPAHSPPCYVYAALAGLQSHWPGGWAKTALLWPFLVSMYGSLSVWLALVMSGVAVLPWLVWTIRVKRRDDPPSSLPATESPTPGE